MIEKLSNFPTINKKYYFEGISFTIERSLLSEDEGKEYEEIIKELWYEIISTPEGRTELKKTKSNLSVMDCISFDNTNSAFILIKKLPEQFLDKFSSTHKLIKKMNEYIEFDDGISVYKKKLKKELQEKVDTILGYSNCTIFDSNSKEIRSVRVSSVS